MMNTFIWIYSKLLIETVLNVCEQSLKNRSSYTCCFLYKTDWYLRLVCKKELIFISSLLHPEPLIACLIIDKDFVLKKCLVISSYRHLCMITSKWSFQYFYQMGLDFLCCLHVLWYMHASCDRHMVCPSKIWQRRRNRANFISKELSKQCILQ